MLLLKYHSRRMPAGCSLINESFRFTLGKLGKRLEIYMRPVLTFEQVVIFFRLLEITDAAVKQTAVLLFKRPELCFVLADCLWGDERIKPHMPPWVF